MAEIPVALGVDAGSTTCKLVAVDKAGVITHWFIEAAEPRVEEQVARLVEELRLTLKLDSDLPLVATGYGRKLVRNTRLNITEITCHARGVFEALGKPGTLVDIGGQDTKVIVIGSGGKVIDFIMNDKCAAGTGRYLEYTAGRLKVPIEELASRALSTADEETISSTCTVFAESEIISLIAHGAKLESILKGLHRSLISRVMALVGTVGMKPPLMLSGGVAMNEAVQQMLSQSSGETVLLPEHPQLMGAYGAALINLER